MTTGDAAAVCEADGTLLVRGATANTLPARRPSGMWCTMCGSNDGVDGTGNCVRCGRRSSLPRATLSGAMGANVGELTIVRAHGEGDMWVTDRSGEIRLLVFGPKERILAEVSALERPDHPFPVVLATGYAVEVGDYALLTLGVDDAEPLLQATLTLASGKDLVRQVLLAAAKLEARGIAWEPSPTDIYVKAGGEIVILRARGARKLLTAEPFDAKRVMEALAVALLPDPFSLTTPAVVRLLLPRFNFSTAATRTIADTHADLAHAETVAASTTPSTVAELCDPGLRRHHSEDATATARVEVTGQPFTVLIVCDGVSSSTHGGEAAAIAASVARDRLVDFARENDADGAWKSASPEHVDERVSRAVNDAIHSAHLAICGAEIAYGDGAPPGTTIVAAVVFREKLTVGWVGDSRAYWVSERRAELCTTDHSWVNDAIARGALTESDAMASPFAHALTRCLGPLEGGASEGSRADVRTKALDLPGRLILCTDGLWNYFPAADTIATLVRDAGKDAPASAVARFLVCRALAEGGGDNVSVVVHDVV